MNGSRVLSRRSAALAFTWGLAEATVFFIVPDVYLSRRAIESTRAGLLACLWALAGALLGGSLLFALSHDRAFADAALHAFDRLPGISPALIERTGQRLHEQGAVGFFTSAATGAPYKLCVVHAASGSLSWGVFLAVSAAARLIRFAAVALLAAFVAQRLLRFMSVMAKKRVHFIAWVVFYAVYFVAMAG